MKALLLIAILFSIFACKTQPIGNEDRLKIRHEARSKN